MSSAAQLDPPAVSPPSLTHWQAASPLSQSIDLPANGPGLLTAADPPLASIGVMSDIQYAPQENGQDYLKTETRYFRHAIPTAERAMQDLQDAAEARGGPTTHHAMHLGDLVDGLNQANGTAEAALDELLRRLPPPATVRNEQDPEPSSGAAASAASSPFPGLSLYHVIGNHEIVNFPRRVWADRLGMGDLARRSIAQAEKRGPIDQVDLKLEQPVMFPEQPTKPAEKNDHTSSNNSNNNANDDHAFSNADPLYYDFTLADGRYRFVMLDSYDIAVNGRDPNDPVLQQATDILKKYNKGENLYAPYGDTYHTRRFVAFNGGIGERQLKWLVRVLEDARDNHQYVVLCSHVSFDPRVTANFLQVWNQHELIQIIDRHPHIVACLHGHSHAGGHFTDEHGLHHHTFEAILTTPDERMSHGRLDLYDDRMELRGVDLMASRTMPISDRAKKLYAQK